MSKRLNDYFAPLCRFYAGGDAVISWYNALTDPQAKLYKIAQQPDAAVLIWAMGIIGVALVLDALMNDVTPDQIKIGKWEIRLQWKKAFEQRHWLFVMLALSYAAHPYIAERAGYVVSSVTFFYWNALQNIVLAFFDVKQRTRIVGWQRAFS